MRQPSGGRSPASGAGRAPTAGGLRPGRGYRGAAWALLGLGGTTAAAVWWSVALRGFWPVSSPDTFIYFYPNLHYLADSLAAGAGVFWTRLQNCGQPFFGNGQIGVLYPPNWLFLVLPPPLALAASNTFHFCLGPFGMLFLARQLRLHPAAALTAALAVMTGDYLWMLAYWQPTPLAPFAWMPWAFALTERALRRPSYEGAIGLAAALTLQLLASYPQTSFFTYQVIGLRLLWALVAPRGVRPWRGIAAVAVGATLPLGLAAVKLLPGLEFADLSIRAAGLSRDDVLGGAAYHQTWPQFRDQLPFLLSNSFIVVPWGVGFIALACADRTRRRLVWFYFAVALLFVLLSFDNALLDLYLRLPLGTLFRLPVRFRWPASVLAALLVGIGAQVFLHAVMRGGRAALLAVAALLLGVAGLTWLGHALPSAWKLGGIAGAGAALLLWRLGVGGWRWGVPAGAALLLLLPIGLGLHRVATAVEDPSHAPSLWRRARELEAVRAAMTLQDRAYLFEDYRRGNDWSVLAKSASLFGIAGVSDYEPQTSLRFADYLLALRGKGPYAGFNLFEFAPRTPRRRALLDLVAARFVVAHTDEPLRLDTAAPPLREIVREGPFLVAENPSALPRAFYVPTAEVAPDAARLLERLGAPGHDARRVALLEALPPDGFLGTTPAAHGQATITADSGEEVSIAVTADAPGFLFLSDQDYPGWEATVNDAPVPILRANYAFRLVRVPAGASTVVFRYRPRPLRIGAVVSLATLLLCAVPFVWRLRRQTM